MDNKQVYIKDIIITITYKVNKVNLEIINVIVKITVMKANQAYFFDIMIMLFDDLYEILVQVFSTFMGYILFCFIFNFLVLSKIVIFILIGIYM